MVVFLIATLISFVPYWFAMEWHDKQDFTPKQGVVSFFAIIAISVIINLCTQSLLRNLT